MRKSVLTYLFLGFVLVLCSVMGTVWANEEKEELVRYIMVDMMDGVSHRWALNEVDSFTQDFDSVHIWQDDSAVFSSARRDVSWVYFEDLMTYWVAYRPSDVTNGVVNPTGGGKFAQSDIIHLEAVPNEHYHFTHWNDGNTDNPRTIVVNRSFTYLAYFALDTFHVTTSCVPVEGGSVSVSVSVSVSGSGYYAWGETATLTAEPAFGYSFTSWSDGVTDNPRVVTITQDSTFAASFKRIMLALTVNANDSKMGVVIGSGNYPMGDTVEISATPHPYYQFTGWSDGNTDNPRQVILLENTTLTATFERTTAVLTVVSEDENKGTTTGSGTYPIGSTVEIEATPNEHYYFSRWQDGNTDNPRQVVMTPTSNEYTAYFEPFYSVTIDAAGGVNTMAEDTYYQPAGSTLEISNPTRDKHAFVGWNINGTLVPVDGGSYLYTFSENGITLTAVWKPFSKLTIDANGGVNTMGQDVYYRPAGSTLDISNPTREGYKFVGWERSTSQNISNFQGFTTSGTDEVVFDGETYYDLGRGYMYEDAITVNVWAHMDDWALAEKGKGMRLFSCAQDGGFNIRADYFNEPQIQLNIWDADANKYLEIRSDKKWSDLSSGWHMFTFTMDGDSVRLFIDSEQTGETLPINRIKYHETNHLLIGAEAYTGEVAEYKPYFEGKMKNFCILPNALSTEEISDLYEHEGLARFYFPDHDVTLKAVWKPYYTLTMRSNNDEMGTVSPESGLRLEGEEVVLEAEPKEGYTFFCWEAPSNSPIGEGLSHEILSTNPLRVTVTGDVTYTAIFQEDIEWYVHVTDVSAFNVVSNNNQTGHWAYVKEGVEASACSGHPVNRIRLNVAKEGQMKIAIASDTEYRVWDTIQLVNATKYPTQATLQVYKIKPVVLKKNERLVFCEKNDAGCFWWDNRTCADGNFVNSLTIANLSGRQEPNRYNLSIDIGWYPDGTVGGDPTEIIEGYTMLDWQPVHYAFWDCVVLKDRLNTVDDGGIEAVQYDFTASAVRFTREDIPVGSKLIIKAGWGIRSDRWEKAVGGSSLARPKPIVGPAVVEIDESFWEDAYYRAFNVGFPGSFDVASPISVEGHEVEVAEALTILVPKE